MHDQQIFKDGDEVYVWIYDPVPFKTFCIGLLLGMYDTSTPFSMCANYCHGRGKNCNAATEPQSKCILICR